jgi:hypothetical protein
VSAARRAKVEAELVEGHKGVVVAIRHRDEGVWRPLPGTRGARTAPLAATSVA